MSCKHPNRPKLSRLCQPLRMLDEDEGGRFGSNLAPSSSVSNNRESGKRREMAPGHTAHLTAGKRKRWCPPSLSPTTPSAHQLLVTQRLCGGGGGSSAEERSQKTRQSVQAPASLYTCFFHFFSFSFLPRDGKVQTKRRNRQVMRWPSQAGLSLDAGRLTVPPTSPALG
ncbi:hypothetical protein LX32DRAFT_344907 [Colletotrichum zoysiae]|uniref:Uncharacterized protein n=1 Tax=Colletotrichum zoysiae TaxID=1216348 RepID=A0AAD9M2R0_9PEZI|nr:hypothetical protein LX32DRAFT_344907 [Colletotrichum zoysiae]